MPATPDTTSCASCGHAFSIDGLFCPACGTAKARDFEGDPLLGTRIGERFLIIERIGHGASGTIYKGEHVTLRRKVAVKVLHHELSRDDLAMERFRREATTVGEIDNDHIVEIHDFGRTSDGRLYLAMELLEGETLDDVLARERQLSIEQTVDVLIQLGESLIEAHAMGYVHRDLRPRNIYLADRRGRANFVKLLDFGLAKLVEKEGEAASTSLGMTFGEPKYMSPEQARGDAVDRRADIYSLGCIGYEMLTGEPPFSGGKVFDILTHHVDTVPPPPSERRSDVPHWLDVAITRMLAKRADDRFTTVFRMVGALRQGLSSGEVMTDEVARRRETNPPPSVSRAMEKLSGKHGVPEPIEPRDTERDSERIERRIEQERPDQTQRGHQPPEHLEDEEQDDDLRATVRREVDPDKLRDRIQAAGKRPTSSSGSGISAAWYADGEQLDGDDELDASMQRKLEKARGASPSRTGVMTTDEDAYYEPGRRLAPIIVGIVGGAVVVVMLLVLLWPSGGDTKKTGQASNAPAVATTADPAIAANPAVAPTPTDGAGVVDAAAGPAPVVPKVVIKKPGTADPKPLVKRDRPKKDRPKRDRPKRDRPKKDPPKDPDPPKNPPSDTSAEDVKQATFFAQLGKTQLRNGDILGAAGNFNKALEKNKKNVDAVAGLGEIALSQGSYSAAIGHLRKASRMRGSSTIYTLLGEAYLGAGQNPKAVQAFKTALKKNPNNARARDGFNEASGNIPE